MDILVGLVNEDLDSKKFSFFFYVSEFGGLKMKYNSYLNYSNSLFKDFFGIHFDKRRNREDCKSWILNQLLYQIFFFFLSLKKFFSTFEDSETIPMCVLKRMRGAGVGRIVSVLEMVHYG